MERSYTFTMNASASKWIDTGIDLNADDIVNISATGWVYFARFGPWGFPRNPDGSDENGKKEIANGSQWPASGYTRNSLVFRVGNNIFQGGCNTQFKVVAPGRLFATNNDDQTLDNSGQWDITILVKSGLMNLARAFAILRPEGAMGFGHVGFGFETAPNSNRFVFGSTEGHNNEFNIPAGQFNGFWASDEFNVSNYLSLLSARNYHYLKVTTITNPNPQAAISIFKNLETRGYNAINNNCLHSTNWVLQYFGVTHLPTPYSLETMPPTNWYNNFAGKELRF